MYTIVKDNGTKHTVINSDFLEVCNLPDISAVITDTPYGTTKAKWDSVINLENMWTWLGDLSKPTTPILLFAQTPYDKVLGCSNISKLKYEWVWEKTLATGHLNAKKMPMKCHENILTFYDKLPTYNYQKTTGHKLKVSDRGSRIQSELYGASSKGSGYSSTERYPRDVLKFSSDKQKINLNSTQKPLDLLRYLVRTYTNVGDTVLDFTAGSMSLAVACYLEGRNSVCIEKDEVQFNKSVLWLEGCTKDNVYLVRS